MIRMAVSEVEGIGVAAWTAIAEPCVMLDMPLYESGAVLSAADARALAAALVAAADALPA